MLDGILHAQRYRPEIVIRSEAIVRSPEAQVCDISAHIRNGDEGCHIRHIRTEVNLAHMSSKALVVGCERSTKQIQAVVVCISSCLVDNIDRHPMFLVNVSGKIVANCLLMAVEVNVPHGVSTENSD